MISLSLVLLVIVCLAGLVLIPLGLPGLWVMVLGIVGVGVLTDFHGIGLKTIAIATGLAFAGEILEAWVSYHYSRKFGGSRRAGWGALIGGLVGAIVGVPVPVVGSVIGSFAGAFLGAAVLEYSGSSHTPGAIRVGWGAIIARTWAVAAKTSLGLVIAVISLVAALSG
jgi:uncharacterized protein YqgC (DUF456 family)